MLNMNRAYFFQRVRGTIFSGRLSVMQVDGMERILDYRDQHAPDFDDDALAYVLATVKHETDHTMQPVLEKGGKARFFRLYDINGSRPSKARELGNLQPGDGAKFPGMGLVQSTGRANARRARQIVRRLLGEDVDFERTPKLLMKWEYALPVMFEGFRIGAWTGHKITTYIGNGRRDYRGARRIVNGTDRAGAIAAMAQAFLDALTQARAAPNPKPAGDQEEEWTPPVEEGADQTTGTPAIKSKTILAQIFQWLGTGGSVGLAALGAIPWQTALVVGGLVLIGGGGYVIYERVLKSRWEGV